MNWSKAQYANVEVQVVYIAGRFRAFMFAKEGAVGRIEAGQQLLWHWGGDQWWEPTGTTPTVLTPDGHRP